MKKMHLFGTSGIRGEAQTLFTNQFCFDLGRTFAKFLDIHKQDGPIAVGTDSRGSSPRILEALESGLSFAGRNVFDEGTSPVPAICHILKTSPCVGSVMVSGSHIAQTLNGLKFFVFDQEMLKDQEEEIESIYNKIKEEVPFQLNTKHVQEENRGNLNYEEMLIGQVKTPIANFKIVLDLCNGAQSEVIARVAERLKLTVFLLNNDPQKGFISRDTEIEGILDQLQQEVLRVKADLGVAFDADGDRAVFVDERGDFIQGDYTGTLIAQDCESQRIVTPINTSQVIDFIGKKIYRTQVGSPFVIQKMKEVGSTYGFEANGGGIFSEIMLSRDGGTMMIKILQLLIKKQKTLGQLVATLPKFYIIKDKINFPQKSDLDVLRKARKKFIGKKIELVDGLKIWIDDSTWILFRLSNNAPEFRVFAESKDKETARKLVDDGIQLIKEVVEH